MNLKESMEEVYGKRKEKGEMQLNYNPKSKQKNKFTSHKLGK